MEQRTNRNGRSIMARTCAATTMAILAAALPFAAMAQTQIVILDNGFTPEGDPLWVDELEPGAALEAPGEEDIAGTGPIFASGYLDDFGFPQSIADAEVQFACGTSDVAQFIDVVSAAQPYYSVKFGALDLFEWDTLVGGCPLDPATIILGPDGEPGGDEKFTYTARAVDSGNLYEIQFHTWRFWSWDFFDFICVDDDSGLSCIASGGRTSYERTSSGPPTPPPPPPPPTLPQLSCTGFFSPLDNPPFVLEGKGNRNMQVRMKLFDADGFEVTDLDILEAPKLMVVFTPSGGGDPVDVSDDAVNNGSGTNQFVYDALEGFWAFKLKGKDFPDAGEYAIASVSGDDTEYEIDPACISGFTKS